MAVLEFLSRKDMKNIGSLGNAIKYCVQDGKTMTEGIKLVSGIGCLPETALKDFQTTKKLFGKEDGIQYYYAVQSFPEDPNIDLFTAHQMALELAEQCYPDHQVFVATHLDTENIHSHILINSVRSTDGKKIHQNKNDIERMRKINDEICIKYNSPVCKPKESKVKPMTSKEYFAAYNGDSWKLDLCIAINNAMQKSKSKEEYIKNLEEAGYEVDWFDNHKFITYKLKRGEKYLKCRDNKLHDEKYLKEVLEDEFKFRQEIVAGRIDIEGEAIERSGEGQAGESSTSATSSNGSRTELDRPDSISSTNERNTDNTDRELKSSGTEGRSAEISGRLQEGLSGYEGRSNGRYESKNSSSQLGQSKSIESSDRCTEHSGTSGNHSDEWQDSDSECDRLWNIGYWERERLCAFGYIESEEQSDDGNNEAYINPLDTEHYNSSVDSDRYNPTSDIITDAGSLIGGLDSVIENESDDPELRERQRRAKQNANAIAEGLQLAAELIEDAKQNRTTNPTDDYDEDDDQGWGPTMDGM